MKTGERFTRRFGRAMFGSILLGLFIFLAYEASNRVFALNNIEVVGAGIDIHVDQQRLPQNVLLFPTHTLEQALQQAYPLLARVRVKKKFPHTIRIELSLRDPVVALQTGERTVLLDMYGYVVSYDPPQERLPSIHIDAPPATLGAQVSDVRVKGAIDFVVAGKTVVTVDSITEADRSSLRVKSATLDIFIPQQGPVSEKVATLQTLMTGFRIKGVLPAVIDLRFDKPIITF